MVLAHVLRQGQQCSIIRAICMAYCGPITPQTLGYTRPERGQGKCPGGDPKPFALIGEMPRRSGRVEQHNAARLQALGKLVRYADRGRPVNDPFFDADPLGHIQGDPLSARQAQISLRFGACPAVRVD